MPACSLHLPLKQKSSSASVWWASHSHIPRAQPRIPSLHVNVDGAAVHKASKSICWHQDLIDYMLRIQDPAFHAIVSGTGGGKWRRLQGGGGTAVPES